ncbi:MAG: MgtC/SapB family protein [Streptosporangiaceae bacterium]
MGAALFMLISKYGFGNVLHPGLVVVDPSRVAAQIVTGVGFLGAGLIFVRRVGVGYRSGRRRRGCRAAGAGGHCHRRLPGRYPGLPVGRPAAVA